MGMTLCQGGLLITFYVNLFDFDKMSVDERSRHNPFSHFLPHGLTTIYHHNSLCCYGETNKSPLMVVLEGFF